MWAKLQGLLQGRLAFNIMPELAKDYSQIVVSLCEIGFQFNRLAVMLRRLVVLAVLVQVPRVVVVRPEMTETRAEYPLVESLEAGPVCPGGTDEAERPAEEGFRKRGQPAVSVCLCRFPCS